jgi:hypothetical protein
MQQLRHKKKVTAALCALLVALVLEPSFCVAAHSHEHAGTGPECIQSHDHDAGCDAAHDPAPCPDGCHFENHRHEQLIAPSKGSSPRATHPLLPAAVPSDLLPRKDAGLEDVAPATFALPPPELQRSTVLLI